MEKQFKPVPDVECLKYKGTPDKPDIKIFVSHRIDLDSETIDNPLYIPVRCGAVYDEREGVTMLGDDTGDNISEKRNTLCEMTVQYWAWKNVKADYYGLCHYRRYFSFSKKSLEITSGGWAEFEKLDHDTKSITGNLSSIDLESISRYGITVGHSFTVDTNLYEQWQSWPTLHKKDLDCMLETIKDLFPHYYPCAKSYIMGKTFFPCNMFIMSKDIFFEYSEWLFTLLNAIEQRIDTSHYSYEENRVLAHISERLLGIFVTYKTKSSNVDLNIREWFYIRDTRAAPAALLPLQQDSVPILMICSDYYVPYCIATLLSIAKTSNCARVYEIIIMEEGVCDINNKRIIDALAPFSNIIIRFIDAELAFSTLNLDSDFNNWIDSQISGTGYNRSLFYRVFSPYILKNYSKYIWLDCDVIVKEDIANLYDTNLENHLVGAVHDLILCCLINGADKRLEEFYKNDYNVTNPYDYVNAGVILLNANKYRKKHSIQQISKIILNEPYQIIEQDAVNILIENDIYYLDERWNVYALGGNYPQYIPFAPADLYAKYSSARENPSIIHYAGSDKPWNNPFTDFASDYWNTIRNTPIYEMTLFRINASRIDPLSSAVYDLQLKHGFFDTRTPARKFADKMLPKGSRRREIAKRILPKGSKRWKFCKKIYFFFAPKYRPKNGFL